MDAYRLTGKPVARLPRPERRVEPVSDRPAAQHSFNLNIGEERTEVRYSYDNQVTVSVQFSTQLLTRIFQP